MFKVGQRVRWRVFLAGKRRPIWREGTVERVGDVFLTVVAEKRVADTYPRRYDLVKGGSGSRVEALTN